MSVAISVIVPAVNEEAAVGRAVRSALAAGAVEVIVVDGGSHDATRQVAASAGATVIDSDPGRALQQNAGARRARGEVLVFLHADNYLDPTALRELDQRMRRDPHLGWGAMRQRIVSPQWSYRCLEWGNAWRVRHRGIAFGDQAIFTRRAWFDQAGGFPPVALMEDLILSRRLRQISPPLLIRGPVYVDARRWRRHGPWRQTWMNWRLQWRFYRGEDPNQLARDYVRHDLGDQHE